MQIEQKNTTQEERTMSGCTSDDRWYPGAAMPPERAAESGRKPIVGKMKHLRWMLFLVAAALVTACAPASHTVLPQIPAQPDALPQIFGVLQEDRVIEGEVVLATDLLVPVGRTLTLRPGATVYVKPNSSTKIDPEWLSAETELLVRGTLRIEGTQERPVTFLPLELPEGQSIAWAGIAFDRSTDSVVRHARIHGAETGILCIGSSPLIRDSLIRGCRYGIVLQQADPILVGNRIEDGEGGVFCWWGSRPELRRNRISGNGEEGLFIDRSSLPRLADNLISGNDFGLVAHDPELATQAGRLTENREDFRQLREGGGK
jgi:parallel beta-helix repeat protein